MRDIRPGAAFEPTYIYRLLTVIKSSLSEKVGIQILDLWNCSAGQSQALKLCKAKPRAPCSNATEISSLTVHCNEAWVSWDLNDRKMLITGLAVWYVGIMEKWLLEWNISYNGVTNWFTFKKWAVVRFYEEFS